LYPLEKFLSEALHIDQLTIVARHVTETFLETYVGEHAGAAFAKRLQSYILSIGNHISQM